MGTGKNGRLSKGSRVGSERTPTIDPALEKHLLGLHRARNVEAFSAAARRLLSAAVPNRVLGLTFQHHPVFPMVAKWTRRVPRNFFSTEPLTTYIAGGARRQLLKIADLFSSR